MKSIYSILFLSIAFISCQADHETDSEAKQSASTNEDSTAVDSIIEPGSTITIESLDEVMITANLYEIDKTSPVIVLCHQARYNKYEYNDIALELNMKGFNCIAIDQRSGGEMENDEGDVFFNQTSIEATEAGKATDYQDAEPDIVAAINYAKLKYGSPIVLWGSSYSSTLALYIASENDNVDAVVSFSPGNYLEKYFGSLIDALPNLKKPMFITSSKEEAEGINELLSKTTLGDNQVQFVPKGEGYHGSRALWPGQEGGEEYWEAIDAFLADVMETFGE